MSPEPRDAAFQEVVVQAIRALADGDPVVSSHFRQAVRNILYEHVQLEDEISQANLTRKLQTAIAQPLHRLNSYLPAAADEKIRIKVLADFIFGGVLSHYARENLIGGQQRRDRPRQHAVAEF